VAVVVEWGLSVSWRWQKVVRLRVLAVEWRSSGGGGRVAVAVERAVAVVAVARAVEWW
jgi:hypothetical protein